MRIDQKTFDGSDITPSHFPAFVNMVFFRTFFNKVCNTLFLKVLLRSNNLIKKISYIIHSINRIIHEKILFKKMLKYLKNF